MCTGWRGLLYVGWGFAEIQDSVSVEFEPVSSISLDKRKVRLNDSFIHIYLHYSQTHVKQAGLAKMELPV